MIRPDDKEPHTVMPHVTRMLEDVPEHKPAQKTRCICVRATQVSVAIASIVWTFVWKNVDEYLQLHFNYKHMVQIWTHGQLLIKAYWLTTHIIIQVFM